MRNSTIWPTLDMVRFVSIVKKIKINEMYNSTIIGTL